jgi:hypothetical protein
MIFRCELSAFVYRPTQSDMVGDVAEKAAAHREERIVHGAVEEHSTSGDAKHPPSIADLRRHQHRADDGSYPAVGTQGDVPKIQLGAKPAVAADPTELYREGPFPFIERTSHGAPESNAQECLRRRGRAQSPRSAR